MTVLIPYTCDLARAMVFVDGENLAIRYGSVLKQRNEAPRPEISYVPNTFVWSTALDEQQKTGSTPAVMRKYYYTAVQGDHPAVADVEKQLKNLGMETPRAYSRRKRGKGQSGST